MCSKSPMPRVRATMPLQVSPVTGPGASHRCSKSGSGHVPDPYREFPLRERACGHACLFPDNGRQPTNSNGAIGCKWPGPFKLYGIVSGYRHDCRGQHFWNNQADVQQRGNYLDLGQHTSFLTLNLSPTSVMVGKPVSLVASLTDVSTTPAKAVSGVSVKLSLKGNSCVGTTGRERQRRVHAIAGDRWNHAASREFRREYGVAAVNRHRRVQRHGAAHYSADVHAAANRVVDAQADADADSDSDGDTDSYANSDAYADAGSQCDAHADAA